MEGEALLPVISGTNVHDHAFLFVPGTMSSKRILASSTFCLSVGSTILLSPTTNKKSDIQPKGLRRGTVARCKAHADSLLSASYKFKVKHQVSVGSKDHAGDDATHPGRVLCFRPKISVNPERA